MLFNEYKSNNLYISDFSAIFSYLIFFLLLYWLYYSSVSYCGVKSPPQHSLSILWNKHFYPLFSNTGELTFGPFIEKAMIANWKVSMVCWVLHSEWQCLFLHVKHKGFYQWRLCFFLWKACFITAKISEEQRKMFAFVQSWCKISCTGLIFGHNQWEKLHFPNVFDHLAFSIFLKIKFLQNKIFSHILSCEFTKQ